MPLPLSPACQVCGPRTDISPDALFKCSRCQVVLYCGRDHQRSHFETHKTVCKEIKKNRDVMIEKQRKVRSNPHDFVSFGTPEDDIEVNIGPYQGILDTRAFMDAKIHLIIALSTIPSRPAIETALAEAMDCLHLCRDDFIGIRLVIPTLHLLLEQYQQAYDFIKWWTTTAQDNYDFNNKELPYLDILGADLTEELPDLNNQEVFFASSIVYVKMMLIKGIEEVIVANELAAKVPQPAVVEDSIRGFLTPERLAKGSGGLQQLHTKLTSQLHQAFRQTHSQNEHFWDAMLDPTPIIQLPVPECYSDGDMNQVKMWIEQNAMLWQNHKDDIREIRRQSA